MQRYKKKKLNVERNMSSSTSSRKQKEYAND